MGKHAGFTEYRSAVRFKSLPPHSLLNAMSTRRPSLASLGREAANYAIECKESRWKKLRIFIGGIFKSSGQFNHNTIPNRIAFRSRKRTYWKF
ncbi:unnamed protein product [Protopolystoma xenopodis]|uniref:Uncharacterized protein n=1 Tax=Protopolystoma xenopodis TaxID=117903 RepID=A0A3S5A6G2_9PLAT|nr:unnamed protein product [Protopolystoma xenopodis]